MTKTIRLTEQQYTALQAIVEAASEFDVVYELVAEATGLTNDETGDAVANLLNETSDAIYGATTE